MMLKISPPILAKMISQFRLGDFEMTENSLALFADNAPMDAISNSLALLAVVRENYATETEDYPTWLQLGIVSDSIKAATARLQ